MYETKKKKNFAVKMTLILLREIWGSHSSAAEKSHLLGCDNALLGENFLHSEGLTVLWNIRNCSPNDKMSHSGTLQS